MKMARKVLVLLTALLILCSMLTINVVAADPTADSELTIPEAIALGLSKNHNSFTEGKYYVTGVITEVYNTTYGNMYITDDEGNTLHLYGTWSETGTTRYDKLSTKPVAGDTITAYGVIGQYDGAAEMKNAWLITNPEADRDPASPELDRDPANPQKYVFADFSAGVQYGQGERHHLDNAVVIDTEQAWFTNELRLYWSPRSTAVITSSKDISAMVLNVGYNKTNLNVFVSANGMVYESIQLDTAAYKNYTVRFPETTRYIMLQTNGSKQVRIPWMTLYFDGEQPEDVVCTEHSYTSEYDPTCNICWGERDVSLPSNIEALSIEQANAIGQGLDNGDRTELEYMVTGIVSKVHTDYGNVFIRDAEGNMFVGYGCSNVTDQSPQIGDTVTLRGKITNYDGQAEIFQGQVLYSSVKRPILFEGNSVSKDVHGLAFCFSMEIEGIAIKKGTYVQADLTNATCAGYPLIKVGVTASNGTDEVLDIEGKRIYDLDNDMALFAYRITNIPDTASDREITMIPYFVVLIDGVETTIYGEAQTATYNGVLENIDA